MSYCNECPNHDACDTGCIIGAARLSRTPSLREEMNDVLRDFESGIESAMEHSCQCGTWEGELSCRHCSLWESARSKAKKRIAEEIAPSTQPGEPQAPTTAGSSPAALSAIGATVDGVDVPREWPAEALDGPRSEPEALVAWLGTAERFGAEEAIKIMQKRLDRLEAMQTK